MGNLWQDIATAVVLLVAIGYLAFRLRQFIRRKGFPACGCGGQCPAQTPAPPLVSLDERSDQ
jgi:hypothetical protein